MSGDSRMSVKEYLEFERASKRKHEFLNGEVVALAGGTVEHATLSGNMFYLLKEALEKDGSCRVFTGDMCVLVGGKQYVYPDVTVSCDDADYRPGNVLLRSPRLIVEVLSPKTEMRDRGQKLGWYQEHPGVEEYLLVNTRVQRVEMYRRERREGGERWRYLIYEPGEEIVIASLDIHIAVDELYGDLEIPVEEEEE